MADFNISLKFKAVNLVTRPVQKVREAVQKLRRVQDATTRTTEQATRKTNGYNRSLREVIKTTRQLSAAREKLSRSFVTAGGASLVSQQSASIGRNILNPLSTSIGNAAMFEDFEVSLKVLLGSADKAKQRLGELSTFAASTPFELPEVVRASTVLETLTNGALATGKQLRLLGDVSAGTGQPIEELAIHFGRLYDGIQAGRPVGEALMRLQEVGAVNGQVRSEIEKMIKAGIDGDTIWAHITQSFGRYSGLMEDRSKAWNGITSNVGDSWTILTKTLGNPIKDKLKPVLVEISEAMSVMSAWLERHPRWTLALGLLTVAAAVVAFTIAGIAGAIAVLLPAMGMAKVGWTALTAAKARFVVWGGRSRIVALLNVASLKAMGLSALTASKLMLILAAGGIKSLVIGMWSLGASAIPFLIGMFSTLSAAIMSIPVFGWIIAAITLVVFLIYKYWTPIKKFMIRLWENISDGLIAAWDWIVAKVKAYINWIVSVAKWVKEQFSWFFDDEDEKEKTLTSVTKKIEESSPARKVSPRSGRARRATAIAAGVTAAALPVAAANAEPVTPISRSASASTTINAPINIHTQPGMDEQEVALQVTRALDEHSRKAQAAQRRRFYD